MAPDLLWRDLMDFGSPNSVAIILVYTNVRTHMDRLYPKVGPC